MLCDCAGLLSALFRDCAVSLFAVAMEFCEWAVVVSVGGAAPVRTSSWRAACRKAVASLIQFLEVALLVK